MQLVLSFPALALSDGGQNTGTSSILCFPKFSCLCFCQLAAEKLDLFIRQ